MTAHRLTLFVLSLLVVGLLLSGCGSASPAAEQTATPLPQVTEQEPAAPTSVPPTLPPAASPASTTETSPLPTPTALPAVAPTSGPDSSPLPTPTAEASTNPASASQAGPSLMSLTVLHTNDNWGETEPCG
jgi:hypothetical protein